MNVETETAFDGASINVDVVLSKEDVRDIQCGEVVEDRLYETTDAEKRPMGINIKSKEAYNERKKLIREASSFKDKAWNELEDNETEIFDDVLDALFEVNAALLDMNERIVRSNDDVTKVYSEVLEAYDIQKSIDTHDYYKMVQSQYR